MKAKSLRFLINILLLAGFVFIASVLTFICDTQKYASATEVTLEDITGSDSEDDDPFGFSGNIGGLEFEYTGDKENEETSVPATLQILLVLTVITLAPSILVMLTSFTRIIVVLHFVRTALGTQTTPPNQVLIGLALFLTLFIMSPVITDINQNAVTPYSEGTITREEALEAGMKPVRDFMIEEIREDDLLLFLDMAGIEEVNSDADVPTYVLIPAFIISELQTAFIIGFLIYIPFIIIDMVVSSTLMSMGMMMLPPTTISMPFKIVLFIMADGWNLIVGEVVRTFYD